ncbi:MAG: undecaprenyl/decaprenyl-phosphate alpha-N-acetylglucosaminyl 1-phosphate transferase, partial [Bacteroidia bacterium]|nr:undecaprenyl/decaprenyl-phosphate alpha-N-acetylglucosaminyl 1-phosphate transferase [Bacteroidia bacterium]
AFLMGLADDAYDTNPMLKFSSQAFCGIIFIFCGISINIFSNMYLNYCITMVWVVGLMNSINLLDNMDAVSSVAIIGALLSLISVLLINHYTTSVFVTLEVGMLSAVCAFLLFNWHPSKMFMGDTGTQFLGAFLASASILFLWNNLSLKGGPVQAVPAIQPGKNILSVLLTFALPIMDTTVVFINRLLKGTSPFVGGKDHTTHHLYYLGMKERQIALLYGSYSALCFLGVVAINKYLTEWPAAYEYVTAGFLIASFVMLFVITRVKKQAI